MFLKQKINFTDCIETYFSDCRIKIAMLEKLKKIRQELLFGVESNDLLYIKFLINDIDSLIYSESKMEVYDIFIKNKKFGELQRFLDENKGELLFRMEMGSTSNCVIKLSEDKVDELRELNKSWFLNKK